MPTRERHRHCRRCDRATWQFRDTLPYPGIRWIGLAPLVWLVNAVAFPWVCPECQGRKRPDG